RADEAGRDLADDRPADELPRPIATVALGDEHVEHGRRQDHRHRHQVGVDDRQDRRGDEVGAEPDRALHDRAHRHGHGREHHAEGAHPLGRAPAGALPFAELSAGAPSAWLIQVAYISAYCPPSATSSSWVPSSTIPPPSTTAIRSARIAVARRWAMMIAVRP